MRCPTRGILLVLPVLIAAAGAGRAADWPQWLGADRDGVWRETGLLEKFPKGGPKVLWRVPVGTGYSGPAVVGDRVYVMDRERAKDEKGQPLRPTRQELAGSVAAHCNLV